MTDAYVAMTGPASRRQQGEPLRGVSARALVPAIIAALLFVGIMVSVIREASWVATFDNTVEAAVIGMRTEALHPVFRTLSFIGSSKVLPVIVLVFLVFLLVKRQFKAALFAIIVIGVAFLVCLGLKHGIGRPRPLDFLLDAELVETEPCFPSGHSWNSLMIFSTIFVVLNVYTANIKRFRGVARLFLVIAIVLPLAIAFSRLYMGEHYPTDVAGGLLGALFLTLLTGSWYMRRFTVREVATPQPTSGWQQVTPARWEAGGKRSAVPRPAATDSRQSADTTVVLEPTRKPSSGDGGYVGKHAR